MKVFAYSALSFAAATRRAAGVEPVTCPPMDAESLDPTVLQGHDLLYFDLHGVPGGSAWYGDGSCAALRAEQIAVLDLSGCTVFALSCYLADEDSPMLDALLKAGALYVIGGEGENWAPRIEPSFGAGLLGIWVRRLMDFGMDPLKALAIAKQRVKLAMQKPADWGADMAALQREAAADTLQFRAYFRKV